MIDVTGYWTKEFAKDNHIHSPNLSKYISKLLENEKEMMIYDLGCGMGDYLYDLYNVGFKNLLGVEYDPLEKHQNIHIVRHNLTKPILFEKKGNVISLEVGEHIPNEFQDIFIKNITENCANYLITSWAIRGQGGHGHVNCLNNDEVIPLIVNEGFEFLEKETKEARNSIEDFCIYFKDTILIFKKNEEC